MSPTGELVLLTREQLREEIESAVRKAVSGGIHPDAEFYDAVELARIWRVTPRTIQNFARFRGLPHERVGQGYRFRKADVAEWLHRVALLPGGNARIAHDQLQRLREASGE
jgi:excisionase family DNA binding protein